LEIQRPGGVGQQLGITDDYRNANPANFLFGDGLQNYLWTNAGRIAHGDGNARQGPTVSRARIR
jgi:hypothetical protein